MKNKKLFLAGATVATLVVATVITTVGVYAQDTDNRFNLFGRISEILNIQEDDLTNAFQTARTEQINQALQDGKIDQEQADRMLERIEDGEFFMRGRHGHMEKREHIEEMAEFLGLTTDELRDAHQSGQTLIQIAEANGKTEAELKQFIKTNMTEHINEMLEEGNIDQDRADEMLENIDEKIDEVINRTMDDGRERGFRG